ncbi:hypothetical protein HDU67_004459 [Dinochytrium kinnereticum]|nr:hypothetical protein HDU67_004459 [Dinochytrium kinnereticum]
MTTATAMPEEGSTSTAMTAHGRKVVRNRRLMFIDMIVNGERGTGLQMEELTEFADYFSEEELKRKDPQLFEFYIGRHIPDSEKRQAFTEDMSLVDRMYHNIAEGDYRDILEGRDPSGMEMDGDADDEADDTEMKMAFAAKPTYSSQPLPTPHQAPVEQESDEDTEEFDSDDEEGRAQAKARKEARKARHLSRSQNPPQHTTAIAPPKPILRRQPPPPRAPSPPRQQPQRDNGPPTLSFDEREELRVEFIRIIKERFLAGLDESFDYSRVDANEAFDDLGQMERDAEDAYFDSEEPEGLEEGRVGVGRVGYGRASVVVVGEEEYDY